MGGTDTGKLCFAAFMAGALIWRGYDMLRRRGGVRGSVSMVWSLYALIVLTGVVFVCTTVEFFLVPREHSLLVSIFGVALFVAANVLRLVAIRTLDRFWSLHIEIRDSQQLIEEGVYGYLRHPAYAAFILEHLAIPLVGNAWYSLAAAAFLYMPMLLFRMHKEEEALTAKFGDQYREYRRRVGAVVPHPSALANLWRTRQASS